MVKGETCFGKSAENDLSAQSRKQDAEDSLRRADQLWTYLLQDPALAHENKVVDGHNRQEKHLDQRERGVVVVVASGNNMWLAPPISPILVEGAG